MTLLYPNAAVSRRWEGALQARLRRAPIETFLRSHDLKVSAAGASRLTDNLIRTTVHIVQWGFIATESIADAEQDAVSEIACSICHELVCLIDEPDSWRIAALVSAAELLSAGVGRRVAAFKAAAAAREFLSKLHTRTLSPGIRNIGMQAALAVQSNHADQLARTRQLITDSIRGADGERRAPAPIAALLSYSAEQRPRLRLVVGAEPAGRKRDSV